MLSAPVPAPPSMLSPAPASGHVPLEDDVVITSYPFECCAIRNQFATAPDILITNSGWRSERPFWADHRSLIMFADQRAVEFQIQILRGIMVTQH